MADPNNVGKKPIILEMEPGTYWWCTCGKSENEPFCYGAHQNLGLLPLEVKIEEKKRVAWCTCKQTKKKPYCDGTHASL
jgi:CDGSH-type Zn-finger protein